jgi:quercetin dioxygenase-like cupin family protein
MTEIRPRVREAHDHQHLQWVGESTVKVLLDAELTGGAFSLFDMRCLKGDASAIHQHSRDDEVFVLLEGLVTFYSGDDHQQVGPDSAVFLPRGIPHGYRVDSDTARLLFFTAPGGLEVMMRAAGFDLAEPLPDGWVADVAKVAEGAAAAGVSIVGPPPGPDADTTSD